MPVEKGKVRAALDAKFKGKSVSRELKEALATRWADNIESEETMDDFIADREGDVLDAAKEADRRATSAAAKGRQDAADAAAGKPKTEDIESEQADADMPAWGRALRDQNNALKEMLTGFQAARTRETLEQRFLQHESVKNIPAGIAKRYVPQSEADWDTAISELQTDFAGVQTAAKPASMFGSDSPSSVRAASPSGTPATAGKVDADIVAFAKNKNEATSPSKN